jgi:hypothetical protein
MNTERTSPSRPNPPEYDPGWVYHGLLISTPGDAVRFLHTLMSGEVLPPDLLTEMTTCHPIGEQSLAGRPWETTGYGLGLMIGRMASVGIAMGHSGAGPGSGRARGLLGLRRTGPMAARPGLLVRANLASEVFSEGRRGLPTKTFATQSAFCVVRSFKFRTRSELSGHRAGVSARTESALKTQGGPSFGRARRADNTPLRSE